MFLGLASLFLGACAVAESVNEKVNRTVSNYKRAQQNYMLAKVAGNPFYEDELLDKRDPNTGRRVEIWENSYDKWIVDYETKQILRSYNEDREQANIEQAKRDGVKYIFSAYEYGVLGFHSNKHLIVDVDTGQKYLIRETDWGEDGQQHPHHVFFKMSKAHLEKCKGEFMRTPPVWAYKVVEDEEPKFIDSSIYCKQTKIYSSPVWTVSR